MEKVRKKKMQVREKVGKPSIHSVFPMICGSGGSKRNLAKAAGAEPAGQMRAENLHAIVARSTFRSQNVQSTQTSDHFWKLSCRKSARPCGAKHISSQNVQSTPFSDHFWTFRCRKKCAPLWREAHFQVNSVKTRGGFGPLFDVQMSKKCTPLWREAHFQVKSVKARGVRTTCWRSDVEKVRAVVARSTFPSQKCQSTRVRTTFGRSEVEKVDTD